jgi:hypothetical protein
MAGIYVQNYVDLVQFALLSNGTLTSTGVNTINGPGPYGQYYYGATSVGVFGGTSSLYSGPLAVTATVELTTLIGDIQTYAASLPAPYKTTLPFASFAADYTFNPGTYYASALTGTNVTLTFNGNNNPNSQIFIIVEEGFTLTRVQFNPINGLKACNIFILTGVSGVGGITITGTALAPQYDVYANLIAAGGAITTTDIATITGTMYAVQEDPTGPITITGDTNLNASYCTYNGGFPDPYPVPVCYLKGTKILTSKGYLPIEDLKVGDRVASKGRIYTDTCNVTKGHVLKHVVWTSKFGISELNNQTRPICIKAGALGDAPTEDLYVSPAHGIILDGRMIAAKDLVNGTTIVQDTTLRAKDIVYHHLELENHSTVIANGVLSESMHGSQNRRFFEKSEVVYPKDALHMLSRPFSALHARR